MDKSVASVRTKLNLQRQKKNPKAEASVLLNSSCYTLSALNLQVKTVVAIIYIKDSLKIDIFPFQSLMFLQKAVDHVSRYKHKNLGTSQCSDAEQQLSKLFSLHSPQSYSKLFCSAAKPVLLRTLFLKQPKFTFPKLQQEVQTTGSHFKPCLEPEMLPNPSVIDCKTCQRCKAKKGCSPEIKWKHAQAERSSAITGILKQAAHSSTARRGTAHKVPLDCAKAK